jgi:exodeoxyribonuclease VII large subunit
MQQRSLFGEPGRTPAKPRENNQPVPAEATSTYPDKKVYTVSELNTELRFLVETTFPLIWVEGEISNFKPASSGHWYFSLKDNSSQMRVVMWASSHRFMKWKPKDGMKVLVHGRLTVFEPRGEYQLDIVQIVPHGKGDLFAAFEQLKGKLQKEGLFDQKRKRPIPMLPKKIGIVTSRQGAVIRDILNILNRRYANLHVLLYPAKVQGEEAAPTIVEGIRVLNRFRDIDVLIVARGGGSLEDLWPFNEEMVARAIVASKIPVISAVGHETDTTISDFVADLRAPTPSAAAELVVLKKEELAERLVNCSKHIFSSAQRRILSMKHRTQILAQHRALAGLPHKIHTFQQRVDDFDHRVRTGLTRYNQIVTRRYLMAGQKLSASQLRHLIEVKRSRLNKILGDMKNVFEKKNNLRKNALSRGAGKLDSLSPLAVLERGYSIACLEEGEILKYSSQTAPGEKIRIRLHRGRLKCQVTEIENE